MIAARVQEEAFGTLDRATLKLLDGLARRDGSRTAERNLKIGTVLVRDYQGRRHTVTVAPDGYVWEGNRQCDRSTRLVSGSRNQRLAAYRDLLVSVSGHLRSHFSAAQIRFIIT